MSKIEKNKGITLIALVVTIIVLLILAGISITVLSGDNGILSRAGEANNKTAVKNLKEQVQMVITARQINKNTKTENIPLKKQLEDEIKNAEIEEISIADGENKYTDVYYVKNGTNYVTVWEDGDVQEGKVEIWDGKKVSCPEFKEENGIWNWYIYTPSQLKFLADFVNNGDGENIPESLEEIVTKAGYNSENITMSAETTIKLMNNLDMGARAGNVENEQEKWLQNEGKFNWLPIGINYNSVLGKLGTFEGNNNIIKGIYIKRNVNFNGIFGNSNAVSDLTIKDSYIEGKSYTGGITGATNGGKIENCNNENTIVKAISQCGGIVGFTQGSIINCNNSGSIECKENDSNTQFGGIAGYVWNNSTVKIEKCTNNGTIIAKGRNIGGIAGQICSCKIIKCTNNGKIIIYGDNIYGVGGITGYIQNSDKISQCVNNAEIKGHGEIIGGICGCIYTCSLIELCVNNGNINSTNDTIGGIVGTRNDSSQWIINNCYNTGILQGNSYIGGLVGINATNRTGSIENCYNIGKIIGVDNLGGLVGETTIDSTVTIVNSCYLNTTATKDFGDDTQSNYAKDKTFIVNDFIFIANEQQNQTIWKCSTGENNGYPVLINTTE